MIFPIKAVIFDADGVLLDSLSIWRELGKRYITDLGYHPIAGMEEILFPMSKTSCQNLLSDNPVQR